MKSPDPFDCSRLELVLPDLLAGRADEATAAVVAEHLTGCPACRRTVEDATRVWHELGRWPDEEPSPELRGRFHDWLADEVDAAARRPAAASATLGAPRGGARWSLVAAALLAGIALGRELPQGRAEATQIAALETQVEALTQRVAVSLLSQGAAAERLRGAAFSRDAGHYDGRIVEALLVAVRSDGNANVRLAAVEALGALLEFAPDAERPAVVRDLVASVPEERSPVVQIALVDLLSVPGAASRGELERLLGSGRLDPYAADRLRRTLEQKS
jgi:anti-sigma factor ChrR (cupin superfamily)